MGISSKQPSIFAIIFAGSLILSACGSGSDSANEVAGGGTDGGGSGGETGGGGTGGGGETGGDGTGGGDTGGGETGGNCVAFPRPQAGQKNTATYNSLVNGAESITTSDYEVLMSSDTMRKIRVLTKQPGQDILEGVHTTEFTIANNYLYETKRTVEQSFGGGLTSTATTTFDPHFPYETDSVCTGQTWNSLQTVTIHIPGPNDTTIARTPFAQETDHKIEAINENKTVGSVNYNTYRATRNVRVLIANKETKETYWVDLQTGLVVATKTRDGAIR